MTKIAPTLYYIAMAFMCLLGGFAVMLSEASAGDSKACLEFNKLDAKMSSYQHIADSSDGLKRIVYIKKIENLEKSYWDLGNLCHK